MYLKRIGGNELKVNIFQNTPFVTVIPASYFFFQLMEATVKIVIVYAVKLRWLLL